MAPEFLLGDIFKIPRSTRKCMYAHIFETYRCIIYETTFWRSSVVEIK